MNIIALIHPLSSRLWRLTLGLLLFLAVFIVGFGTGQRHVQQAWSDQRLQQKAKALEQFLQVAQIQTQQELINQKISTDYETQKSMLALRVPVLRESAIRVCIPASNATGPVPANAESNIGADASPANLVPDPVRDAGAIGCEQLARDAANTTLMLLSFQRWYTEQAKEQATAAEP